MQHAVDPTPRRVASRRCRLPYRGSAVGSHRTCSGRSTSSSVGVRRNDGVDVLLTLLLALLLDVLERSLLHHGQGGGLRELCLNIGLLGSKPGIDVSSILEVAGTNPGLQADHRVE